MAQTPKSATALISSTTPTTLYTVPTGATAIVKTVLSSSLISTFGYVTVNKVSGGTTYPLVRDVATGIQGNNYYPTTMAKNSLDGPITLTAGESLSVSTSSSPQYKFPTTYSLTTNSGQRINNTNYLNGKYIAVGYDNSTQTGLVLTSTDGITWTKQTFPYYMVITDIGFDGTNYVVCGASNQGYIYYSTNLSSWTQVSTGTSTNMFCITYGNSKWLMGGASGVYAYATTPTSWTVGTLSPASTINAVLVINTNFCFGTEAAYRYTADFTTFTTPYIAPYAGTTNSIAFAIDAAGKIYNVNTRSPNGYATTSLYTSTNNAKTFTAIDLSALTARPENYGSIFSFGNGGKTYWQFTHPSTSKYLSSTDGVTWSSQQYTGTYQNTSGNWYSTNLFTMLGTTTAQSILFNWIYNNTGVLLNPIASNGTLGSASVAFTSSGTYIEPNTYGILVPIGNVNSGAWVAISYNVQNTSYSRMWTGTAYNTGSDTTNTANVWYIDAYGPIISGCTRPGNNGFIIGTNSGYVGYSTSSTGGFNVSTQNANGAAVVGIATDGNNASSKIVALYANGYTYYSLDQGINWTAGGAIADSFSYVAFSNNSPLMYSNGTWVAYSYQNGGSFYYSTDGINWIGNPLAIQNMYTLNSNNIFLQADGLNYTTGTSPDNFGLKITAIYPNSYPSVRRMAYVGGTYFVGAGNTLFQSTNLTSWTSNTFNSTQVNNLTYYSSVGSSATSIAYSGSGSTFSVGNALRQQTVDNVSFGQPTALSTALVSLTTTASIIEIT